jgi:hypothetical protein
MRVGEAQHEEAQTDADRQPRQQRDEVWLGPGRRLPVDERTKVHGHEQRRQQRARLQRVHAERQQWDADDGEPAAERALHEGDQDDSSEGQEEQSWGRHADGLCPRRRNELTGAESHKKIRPAVKAPVEAREE